MYLGTTLTNQNNMLQVNKSTLISGNACCHSFQHMLPPHLLSKIWKLKYTKLWFCLLFFMGVKLILNVERIEEEVTRGLKNLHNEQRSNLYPLSNIIREMEWRSMWRAGYVAHMGEKRNVYRVLIGKPEGRRRRRRKDNIKIDFEGIWSEVVDWIFLAQEKDR